MLPAKFRGFASRVGRLASRALAWHKTSERDAALNSASSTSSTARTSRTLLRAILAFFVAAATLLAMLVVSAQQANAYDIYWEYRGEGYLAATTEDSNGKPISVGTNNARYASGAAWFDGPTFSNNGRTVTWKVVFNPQTYYNASRVDTKYEGNIDDGRGTNRPFGENPIFYAYLPKGVSNIQLVRYKYYVERNRRNQSFIRRGYESGDINMCNFSNRGCDTYWNNSVGPGSGETGVGGNNMSQITYSHPDVNSDSNAISKYSIDEIYKWKDEGKFGIGIVDRQSLSYTSRGFIIAPGYEWELSAELDSGYTKDDFYKMPFIFGVTSDNDRSKGKGNYRKNKFAFAGPFDTDGDGIPDKLDYILSMHPNDNDQIKYPAYDNSTKKEMLNDFWGAKTGATYYGGGSNVPITSYGIPIKVKPFAKIWDWNKNDPIPAHFNGNWNAYPYSDDHLYNFTVDDVNKTTTDLPNRVSTTKPKIGMDYSFSGSLPSGVKEDTGRPNSPCNVSRGDKGCVKINHDTGEVTYNPLISDWKRKTRGQDNGLLTFPIEIKYPAPGSYNLVYGNKRNVKHHNLTIRVLSQATQYSPHYDETEVDFHTTGNNGKDSAKPYNKAKDGCNARKPLIDKRGENLPSDVKFIFPDSSNGYGKARYTFGDSKNPVGDPRLLWASLTGNDPLKNTEGIVHFAPSKVTDSGKSFANDASNGNHKKTPVIVKYADGSSSEDLDAGNICSNGGNVDKEKSVVYAPVHVKKYPPEVKLSIKTGGGMHDYLDPNNVNDRIDNGYDASQYEGITNITDRKKIILDSWAKDGDGKIDFRVLCHRTDKNTNAYSLLTPPNNKGTGASGSINGVKFTGFRSWDHTNKQEEEKCKKKNNCKPIDTYTYLTSDSYNNDTLQRSRAVIGAKKLKEDGKYECKVFAFHQGSDSLKKFDGEVKAQAKNKDKNYSNLFDFGNKLGKSDQKDKEWTDGTFTFSVKLKDNQKYNPTYKTIPTIQAGTFANKETNSSDQPKSHTKIMVNGQKVNANGVPDEDLGGVEDGKALPPGTWFEIKKLVKKVDKTQPDKFPSEKELWSNFEDGEDNVKRDEHGKPVMEKGKVVPLNGTGREYGSVTFRPDKWKDAGQYWAEVVVHYPDGSASSDDDSINYKHPVYAKVNVTRDDKDNQLHLNLYKHYYDKVMGDGYDLKVGESLPNDATFDSWMTKSVGKLHQHVICSKKGKDGKYSDYTYNTLPGHVNNTKSKDENEKDGLRFKSQKIWDHASFEQQKQCRLDKKCDKDNYLYDGDGASEQTRGYFGGKAQKTGDYQCKVYVISGKDKSDAFEKAVKANIKKSTSKDPAAGLFDKKDNKYPYGEKGKGYETGSFEIRIHNDNHFYNPKYLDVSVTAGQKVENAVPQSVKSANGADKYQDVVKAGALPDGTWFEFKDAANGFEVNADGTRGKQVSLDWSYWAGNAADKAGDQSNKPDNPSNQKKGKHSANGDGTRYGKVTFHPDQSVAPKAYFKEIVIHYPDGSTSDDPDSGNNGKPVYAKVTVGGLSGADKDLKMTLLRSKDADPIHDTLGSSNSLTVMSGTSLTKNPYVFAWSLKDRSNISLRMMCTKQGEQKWSRGLDDTLNMHLNQNYGEGVQPWKFATADQRKSCSQDSKNCDANLLYGFTKNGKQDSIESAVSRSEDDIAGVPQKAGKYTCAVFALKSNALTVFNNTVNNSLIENKKYSSTDMKTTWFEGVTIGKDWNRITVDVNVIDPPKFALPKTGGEGMSMALLVVAVIGMCVMCGAFFVDQTKWGHAMLVGAAAGMMRGLRFATQNSNSNSNSNRNSKISEIWRSLVKKVKNIRRFDDYSASVKDFVRKATGWLRAAFRRVRRWATERWRC